MSVTDKTDEELEQAIDRTKRTLERDPNSRMARAAHDHAVEELAERKRGEIEELRKQVDSDAVTSFLEADKRNQIRDLKAEVAELEQVIAEDTDD